MEVIKNIKKYIIFCDIINSTKLWSKYGDLMIEEIKSVINIIKSNCEKYNCFLIKIIGDGFMIICDDIENAINFTINVLKLLKNKKSFINEKIYLRTGIFYGNVTKVKIKVQDKYYYDYYGNSVNIASRLESKISYKNTFAVGLNNLNDYKKLKNILNKKDNKFKFKFKILELDKTCRNLSKKRGKKYSKSLKLDYRCKNLKILKGINKNLVILVVKLEDN